ncbi:MAG: DUF2971 domain-containing protein [Rhodobacter sp.]|nr:DUF2971 domain-containing protein [Rhodobacter sp.]
MDTNAETWMDEEISALREGISVRRPTQSQSMFKYVSLNTKKSWEYFAETITTGILRGATSQSLNDPFEMEPHVFDDLRPSVVQRIYGLGGFAEKIRNRRNPKAKPIDANDLETHRKSAERYLNSVRKDYRIISFCERFDSPLLWSHYANSYRGACIHFLGRSFPRSRGLSGYVEYSSFRPVYPLSLALHLQAEKDQRTTSSSRLRQIESEKIHFFTKANEWAYENEIRIVYNSRHHRGLEFDRQGLASIIVAPRMPEKDRDRIQSIVNASDIPNLHIREAKLSSTSFSVEIN